MHLTTLAIYPTAMCQLDCHYCTLSKIPHMKDLDKDFIESYQEPGYYYRQLMELGWDNIKDIHRLEFWGGEPTLALHRTHQTVRDFIEALPKLDVLFFSTNFAHSNIPNEIEGLIDVLGEYPERNFTLMIQLSIDGPPDITDSARGDGVTERFMKNYYYMMDKKWFAHKYPNVVVKTVYKPTLDIVSVKKFLDIDYMKYYYKWMEDELYDPAMSAHDGKYISSICSVPNIASPMEASKEDGIDFAKIEQNALMLSIHNPFKYYNDVVMYSTTRPYQDRNKVLYCGAGRSTVELLPRGKYCGCHRAFLTFCEEYKTDTNPYDIYKPIDQRGLVHDKQLFIYNSAKEYIDFCDRAVRPTTGSSAFLVSQGVIRYLASLGQIEEKYKDPDEAYKAANMIVEYSGQCIYDNYNVCATQMTNLFSLNRLFLNGAIDIIKLASDRRATTFDANRVCKRQLSDYYGYNK